MAGGRTAPRDLTVVAVPSYFAGMAAEHLWAQRVVYGLSTNIDTFRLARVATHEHLAMLRRGTLDLVA